MPEAHRPKYLLLSLFVAGIGLCNNAWQDARAAQLTRLRRNSSTFIELGIQAQSRSQKQWEQLMAEMKVSGLDELILQWSQYDQQPQDYLTSLKAILDASKKEQVNVLIGLSGSQTWGTERGLQPLFLQKEYDTSVEIATQVLPMTWNHPFFVGWYISHEAEAISMQPADKEAIFGFYSKLSSKLKQMTPNHIVAMSGYQQTEIPEHFDAVDWWLQLLKSTSISRLYFQDGYGVLRLSPIETSNQLMRALATRLSSHAVSLWIVIEAFEETGDVYDTMRIYNAFPTSIKRLCEQVKQAQDLDLPIALYTFDVYMRGPFRSAAGKLGQQWLNTDGCQKAP